MHLLVGLTDMLGESLPYCPFRFNSVPADALASFIARPSADMVSSLYLLYRQNVILLAKYVCFLEFWAFE